MDAARREVQAFAAASQTDALKQLAATVRELLATPDLNLESLEPATVKAIDRAEALLKKLRL